MVENANSVRWLIFFGAAIGAMLLLMILPQTASSLLLVVSAVVGAGVAVRRSQQTVLELTQTAASYARAAFTFDRNYVMPWTDWATRNHRILVPALALSSLVFMVVSALNFRPGLLEDNLTYAAMCLFAGGITLGMALWFGRKDVSRVLPLPSLADKIASSARMNWLLTILGIVVFAVLVDMNTLWLPVAWLTGVSHHLQFALFVMAVALLAAGFAGFRPSAVRGSWHSLRQWLAGADRRTVLIVLGITALAAFLRFWQLGQTARFEVDELQAVSAVNRLSSQLDIPILTVIKPLHWNWAWLFPYVETQFVNIIGHNWAGLRFIGALFGTLTIPLQYALARAWFDRKTALIAALLLAVFPPFVHFSRFSLINIADPLIGTLTFACLSWGVRTNRRICFVLGGVALGMSQYFYEGGRLLFPPLAVAWLIALALFWRHKFNRHYAILTVMLAVLVALPFYLTLQAQGRPFGERLGDNFMGWEFFVTPGNPVLLHIVQPFLSFIHDHDSSLSYMYYGGSQPLLLWYMVIPFLLGCFYVVWRAAKPGMMLVALWMLLTILGNALVRDNGSDVRYLAVFPILTLLAAVGIRYVAPLIWPRESRYLKWGLIGLLVVLCAGQISYYWGTHVPLYEAAFRHLRPGHDLDDAVLRASQLPPGTQVHIVTEWPDVDNYYKIQVAWMSEYFLNNSPLISILVVGQDEFTADYVSRLSHNVNQAFFVILGDQPILNRIHPYFKLEDGLPSPYTDVPINEQFMLYFVPSS